ncbi:hypothetical protein IGI04_034604, partial [Brassica rapa subsp. trilocularis]
MGDGLAGTKEAANSTIWWFSRRTVLMTVPDSGATRREENHWRLLCFWIVKGEGSISLTIEKIILNPLSISFIYMKCMTSRHTRRNAQGELATFTNQELARLERTNRQQPRQTDTTMGDHANQEQLTAQLQQMQQQMLQMQQTIQAQQDAAEQAALAQQEQQAQTGWRTRMNAKSEPPVALRTIMYYLLLRHITISVFKKKKKNEINVMEKGKKEKKHGATGKVEQEVGLELHWMGDGLAGTKEAANSAIWWFSRRTVLMTVPDSGATRPPVALIYHIFLFLFTFYAILERRKPLETFVLLDCKGRRLHLSHHREDYPEPSFYLFYLH